MVDHIYRCHPFPTCHSLQFLLWSQPHLCDADTLLARITKTKSDSKSKALNTKLGSIQLPLNVLPCIVKTNFTHISFDTNNRKRNEEILQVSFVLPLEPEDLHKISLSSSFPALSWERLSVTLYSHDRNLSGPGLR